MWRIWALKKKSFMMFRIRALMRKSYSFGEEARKAAVVPGGELE